MVAMVGALSMTEVLDMDDLIGDALMERDARRRIAAHRESEKTMSEIKARLAVR